jgi:hypothetical protein
MEYLKILFCSSLAADRLSSPLPDFVPNTHPEELSYAPLTEPGTSARPSRNLKRRATPLVVSRPSTPPPETSIKEDEAPLQRKVSDTITNNIIFDT